MMTTVLSSQPVQQQRNSFNIISWTALLVGILDIAAVILKHFIETGKDPSPLFKFIASGVFGKAALEGGLLMIVWGIVFHFMIAFLFSLVLYLIYPIAVQWLKNKWVTGLVYGMTIWIIMNQAVLPLSLAPQSTGFNPAQAAIEIAILICMAGIPIALIAHKYHYRPRMKK